MGKFLENGSENKISEPDVNSYLSLKSKIFRRCREIAEYYYESGLWTRGINYVTDFYIESDRIEIFEGAHGCDLMFYLEDFYDDEKLEKAIEKDIKLYKEEN